MIAYGQSHLLKALEGSMEFSTFQYPRRTPLQIRKIYVGILARNVCQPRQG